MTLSYSTVRLMNNIIEARFPEQTTFNYHQLCLVLDDFLNKKEDYLNPEKKPSKYEQSKKLMTYILTRNIANYDSFILLSSEKGTGKSSMAIQLARVWCSLLGIKFDPNKHIAYTNPQAVERIDNLPPFSPLILDEAVNFALASEWAKKENRDLRIKLAQVRTKHLLVILCFPMKIKKMEKTYLESYVNYWLDLFDRGTAAVYVKDRNPAHDSWRIKDFEQLGSFSEFTGSSRVREILKKHPNFWFVLKVPKVPENVYGKYIKVREANVYNDASVTSNLTKFDLVRAMMIVTLKEILTRDNSMSMKRLLLHFQNEYGIEISRQLFEGVIADADMLIKKVKEEKLGQQISDGQTKTTEPDTTPADDVQDATGE